MVLTAIGLMVQNSTNLYSSSLNLQTAGIPAKRWVIVLTDTLVCIVISIVAVSQSSFYDLLNAFVASLSIWLAPWVMIHLVDWWMRRGRYSLDGLANEKGGVYWGTGGIRWPGMASLLLGMVAAALFSNSGYYVGPLTALFSPSEPFYAPDLSIPVGMIVSGVLYAVLSRRDSSIAAGTEARPTLATQTV